MLAGYAGCLGENARPSTATRLRRKLLGVDELHMYDIYAPMMADASKPHPL